MFPLIPLPIIEAIVETEVGIFAVNVFPLIPLPIIEAMEEQLVCSIGQDIEFPLIPLPIIEAIQ